MIRCDGGAVLRDVLPGPGTELAREHGQDHLQSCVRQIVREFRLEKWVLETAGPRRAGRTHRLSGAPSLALRRRAPAVKILKVRAWRWLHSNWIAAPDVGCVRVRKASRRSSLPSVVRAAVRRTLLVSLLLQLSDVRRARAPSRPHVRERRHLWLLAISSV